MTERDLDLLVQKIRKSLLAKPGKMISDLNSANVPQAAVSLVLRPDRRANELFTLLLKRKTDSRDPWSGQMAFPGGRFVPSDKKISLTALRELLEETSIKSSERDIIGTLDEVFPLTILNIRVTPFVVLAPERISIKIDHKEIETHVWVPLSFFADVGNTTPHIIQRMGQTIEVPSYQFQERFVVWGLTFKIIQDFITKMEGVDLAP